MSAQDENGRCRENTSPVLRVFRTACTDPYENLAREEYLLCRVPAGEVWLYLWQNDRTVVIGRNQNAWQECRVEALDADGGHAARRLSGGGAVYHDLGNLNFTFLARRPLYDRARQTEVIRRAVQSFGIHAEVSGRNDLTVSGRKFSGCAYYESGQACFHHGTVLIGGEKEAMGRYLSPQREKLAAKGVASVESRVAYLGDLVPGLTPEAMAQALITAFAAEYAGEAGLEMCASQEGTAPIAAAAGEDSRAERRLPAPMMPTGAEAAEELRESVCASPARILFSETDEAEIARLREKYASREWIFGRLADFDTELTARTPEGMVTLHLSVSEGIIRGVQVFTDSMDPDHAEKLEKELLGKPFRREELRHILDVDAGDSPA